MRILLVEDDRPLAGALLALLAMSGYAVDCTHDASSAEAMLAAETFDLVILDLNLPELDGLALLKRMRARSGGPAVLILTARGSPEDRVKGLDLGADDYMPKPFDVRELEARVRSLLRRQAGLRSSVVRLGSITLDLVSRTFSTPTGEMELPSRERRLLELLFMRAGRLSRRKPSSNLLRVWMTCFLKMPSSNMFHG